MTATATDIDAIEARYLAGEGTTYDEYKALKAAGKLVTNMYSDIGSGVDPVTYLDEAS